MLHNDLIGLTLSFLDITKYYPDDRMSLIRAMGSVDIKYIDSVWWKCSNCEIKQYPQYPLSKKYYVNGKLHREDGPAIEYTYGTKEWYMCGKRHRADGPAIEVSGSDKAWWVNGERHRTDGPAIEYEDGYMEWWVNGELSSFNKLR